MIHNRAFFLAACLVACGARPPEAPPVVAIPGDAPAPVAAAAPRDDPKPPPRIRPWVWETDEPRARARASREGLPLLVHLSADWSAASLMMAREVWSDPRILLQRTPLVALRIDLTDGSASPDAELWAERYGARVVPTTIVFDAEGREVARIDGACTVEDVLAAIGRAAADP
ncbi:thioredoxin family protein [Polyangium spumosum]|uniref:thioredoxin family protein n=1 Tax=Polyangium spumosum TaxID=889282 RepID=UPI001479076F|nr:thioredoxin family protein [Polyangium spumosum]